MDIPTMIQSSNVFDVKNQSSDPRKWIRIVTILVMAILLIVAFLYSLSTGAVFIPVKTIWGVLMEHHVALPDPMKNVILNFRLPRTLVAMVVGSSLALSGALMQGVMRNPLADPGIIGVSAGAGLMVVTVTLIFPEWVKLTPIVAFIGAWIAVMSSYGLAWNKGCSPLRLILAGVAVNALAGAITSAIMLLYSERVQAVLAWMSGGLNGVSWYHLQLSIPYFGVALLLSVLCIRHANMMLLGDEVAKLLGHSTERSRLLLISISTLLASVAVSIAGLIGFVGLVVPHMARLLVGNNYMFLLPVSALGGAALVLFADTVARSWFEPVSLPVGLLLVVVGAPFFLYLLRNGGVFSGRA